MNLTKENKTFNLFSEKIEISEGRNIYNLLKLEYDNKVLKAQNKFRKVYINENKSIDDVIKNSLRQGQEIIMEYISEAVSDIVDMGFYNIDEEIFINEYYNKNYMYYDCYEEIHDRYMEIVLNEEEKDEYRRRRRENRSRWQGGGFGIGGAIKGATKAGMMNMASGAVHGVRNTAEKIISSIGASYKKSELFNDRNTLQTLIEGVGASIYGIQLAVICFLDKNTDYNVDVVSNKDEKEAEVILKNILCKKVEGKIEFQLLKRIIELNPYNIEIYQYIIKKYGDEMLEVENIAKYFGYDLKEFKERIIDEKYKIINIKTESDAIKLKKLLTNDMLKLGIKGTNKKINIINKKLDEFDKEARTYKGIVYPNKKSKEEAIQKEKVNIILNKVDMNSEYEIRIAIGEILKLGLDKHIEAEYIVDLDRKLAEVNLKARTFDGRVYDTIEECNYARQDKINRTYKGVVYQSCELKQKAEQEDKLSEIWNKADKSNENELLLIRNKVLSLNVNKEIENKYISKIDNKIEEIRILARTLDGVTYDTIEECNYAKQDKINRTYKGVVYQSCELRQKAEQEDKLSEIWNKADKSNEKELLLIRDKILSLNVNKEIENKYISKIDNKIEEIRISARTYKGKVYKSVLDVLEVKEREKEVESRTVGGVVYDTIELAEKARKLEAKKLKIMEIDANRKKLYENKLYLFSNIIIKIAYYFILGFYLLGILIDLEQFWELGIILGVPMVFLGSTFGMFGKFRILKSKGFISRCVISMLFSVVSFITLSVLLY